MLAMYVHPGREVHSVKVQIPPPKDAEYGVGPPDLTSAIHRFHNAFNVSSSEAASVRVSFCFTERMRLSLSCHPQLSVITQVLSQSHSKREGLSEHGN
jgi:hypothetical protein